MQTADFWLRLDALVSATEIVIDRPRGSTHPRYPEFVYPYDYGYLKDTLSADGGGIDVWSGSQPERGVSAILCTVDLVKRDVEIKILWGCSPEETQSILQIHNQGPQSAVLVARPAE